MTRPLVVAAALLWTLGPIRTPGPLDPPWTFGPRPLSALQEPTFRGGVTLINVDAYPRGRDGRVVEGLRAEDFQVLEDGAPQKVDAFEFIRLEPNMPNTERRDPNTQAEGDRLAADPHNRVFVVYLDIFHTTFTGGQLSRRPLVDFLARTIAPNDLFAVATPEVPASQLIFGRRLEALENDLSKVLDSGQRDREISPLGRSPMEARLQTCMNADATLLGDGLVALYREDEMMTNLEQAMVRLSGLRDGRKNFLFISEGWNPQPPSPTLANLVLSGRIPQIAPGRGGALTFDPRTTTTGENRGWCDQQIGELSSIDFQQRFRNLLTMANRANASFYTVDAGGLQALPTMAPRRSRMVCAPDHCDADIFIDKMLQTMEQPSTASLRVLAENTDGIAIFNSNDLGAGMRRIADDLASYYLLGYASTNTKADGRFRKIEVKVRQPNVSVTARRGYTALNSEARTAAATAAASSATAKAVPALIAEELGRLARLRPDAEVFGYGAVRDGRLALAVEISGQEMARGRWRNGADVQATITGMPGGNVTGTARIDAGYRGVVVDIPMPAGAAGPWRVALRISGTEGVLNDQIDVAAPTRDGSALLGAPLVLRGTPAIRIPMRPVADFQFRRNERVRAEWPIGAPLDERLARVLDRRGEALALGATATEVDGAAGRVVDVDLNLAPLAEGDYLIELTAGQGGRTEKSLVAFRVVR